MELKRYLADGTAYRVIGQGPVCMLLHGFAEDGHVWDQQAEQLAESFQLIIPDMPGTGDSAPAFQAHRDITVESAAEIVNKIAEQEGLRSFTLLGHSMGGYITLAFAEKFPQLLNGFGLIHSTALADNEEKLNTRRRSVSFMKDHGVRLFLSQLYPNLYGDTHREDLMGEIERQMKASEAFQPEVLIAYYEMMMARPDRRHILETTEKPVLFIIGAEDKTLNLTDSLAQSHLPLESHIHILENAGHMGMKEEAWKTTEAIRAFLVHLNEN